MLALFFRRLLTKPAALAVLIFLSFFCFYYQAAQQLRSTPMWTRDDTFFRADTTRALKDLTEPSGTGHGHSSGHPNFVIFHNPLGSQLTTLFKASTKGTTKKESSKSASITLTAAGGAGTVAMLYLLLNAFGLPRLRASLFAGVLGFSSVQMFYASTPETYIFSALGITAAAWLAVRKTATHTAWWQLAAVYAWSALTTNIALVGIWALVKFKQAPLKTWAWKLTKSVALTTLIMVVLASVQAWIYPSALPFFIPHSVAKEVGWFTLENLQHPIETSRILLQHQWLSNIVAPEPVRSAFAGLPMASIEAGHWSAFQPAWLLFALWGVFLLLAATALRNRRFYTPPVLAAIGTVVFNFCFFFVFGHDRMLYAALWTSSSVFLVAAGIEAALANRPSWTKPVTALLAVFLLGQAWHNWHFLAKLAATVQ